MRKFFKKALLMALSTVLTGIGAVAICNVNDEQPMLTVAAETVTTDSVQQLVLGNNSIEVQGGLMPTAVVFNLTGAYVIDWAEGEENGVITVVVDAGTEILNLPYAGTFADNESFDLYFFALNGEADTIDIVIKELELPEDGATLTIEEALALEMSLYEGQQYFVTGTVTKYVDSYIGVLCIADENGNEICINGLYKYKKKNIPFDEFWYSDKPLVGAMITVFGGMVTDGDVNQFADARLESCTQPGNDPESALPKDGLILKISRVLELEEKVGGDTLRKYCVEGIVKEIVDTQCGDMYIEDDDGNVLYINGLFDSEGVAKFEDMKIQPKVGEMISVMSILSKQDGEIQLKNARMLECWKPITTLNMDGTTTVDIVEGDYVIAEGTPIMDTYTGAYIITWDDVAVPNLKVNSNTICHSGMILEHGSPLEKMEIQFSTTDGTAVTVEVTVMPYKEVVSELVLGENLINVFDARYGSKAQITTPGEYTIAWAAGEENGVLFIETADGFTKVENMPYTFTVVENKQFVFLLSTSNNLPDNIDVVLMVVAEDAEEPTDSTDTEQPTDSVNPEQPADSVETEPKDEPSITDKVTGIIPESVKNMIPGCSGVVGGIAGGLTALGVATLAILKKKED